MNSVRLFATLLLAITLSACGGGERPDAAHPVPPGTDAEDIDRASIIKQAVFTDLDGNEVTLADYRGKVLVVDFWETWCGPCLQVFPAFQDLREEFPEDFQVLAVTLGMMDGPDDARAFREDHDYDFQFLYDANGTSDQLGIFSIPFKMYIDPDGELIRSEIGSKGRSGDYDSALEVIREHRR